MVHSLVPLHVLFLFLLEDFLNLFGVPNYFYSPSIGAIWCPLRYRPILVCLHVSLHVK